MHGTNNEGDMRNLGGAAQAMATTFKVFVVGGFGLAGIPIFAGFGARTKSWRGFRQEPGVFALLLTGRCHVFLRISAVVPGVRRRAQNRKF
jgi:NADH:ubiquinone oxidoreductase subunit 5 (subunit L)/multisubunit Na+/H+ antiporter MnhA subunit